MTFEEIKTTTNRPSHAAPQQGVYSNALSSDASPKRLTIFALDTVNTPFLDQSYARQQLLKFLANRVSSQEPIALIAIKSDGIKVLHDFTSDPAILVAALKRATGELPAIQGMNVSDPASAEAALLSGFAGETEAYVLLAEREAITATLESFQHVAEAFAGVPGRKSLIWATAGFPFGLDPVSGTLVSPTVFHQGSIANSGTGMNPRTGALPPLPSNTNVRSGDDLTSLEPLYRRTIEMLNDANISIYPVDARGLIVFFPGADTSRIRGWSAYNQAIFESTRETMVGFADMTGGKAFYNRNDLDVAFQKAADDSSTYYMLGYYLDKNAKPGWHKLHVKVKRGGTEVRARNGFFVSDIEKEDPRKMDISLALVSPLDYTGLPLTVRWTSIQGNGAKRKIHFQASLAAESNLVDTSNNNLVNLEFVMMARTSTGTAADQLSQHIQTNLKPDGLQNFQRNGLSYSNDLLVPVGDYAVRFVVRNNADGRMGSLTAPLHVAP